MLTVLKKRKKGFYSALATMFLTLLSSIFYVLLSVGDFNVGVIIAFALALFAGVLYVLFRWRYFDVLSLFGLLAGAAFFLISKIFYISAVFVGIDYKGFDALFLCDSISILLTISAGILSVIWEQK